MKEITVEKFAEMVRKDLAQFVERSTKQFPGETHSEDEWKDAFLYRKW